MKVTGNPLLMGASSKLGNIIVKQYENKTVVTAIPDMSGRKLTEKQKEGNLQMRMAIKAAKALTATPQLKQRACEMLKVEANRVFRALVKQWLLTNGDGDVFGKTEAEEQDKKTLAALQSIITTETPDGEVMLFGNRVKGAYNTQTDWDILVLTANDHPATFKWELQEKLFTVTIQQGARVNLLLAQKAKWHTEKEYEVLRKKIEGELQSVGK